MNTPLNPLDENKKRAAFKRFSQMSAAGLAVLSLSAFTDVAAKQLPANVKNCVVKEQNAQLANLLSDKPFAIDEEFLNYSEVPTPVPYNNGHSNYSNYTNNYGDYSENYSNNYSNYCNGAV